MNYFKEKFKQTQKDFAYSAHRTRLMVDNFCKIEIQITSLLASFISFIIFCDNFQKISQNIKWILFSSLLFFIVSLFFGLFNTHFKGVFWEKITDKKHIILKEFYKEIENKNYSIGCINKIYDSLMASDKDYSPRWPWIVQTICLLVGSLLLLFSVYSYII